MKKLICLFLLVFYSQITLAARDGWYIGIGSILDQISPSKELFTMADGRILKPGVPVGGGGSTAYKENLVYPSSYRFGTGGAGKLYFEYWKEYPAKIYFEWVSYVAKKRYGITVDVPSYLPRENGTTLALLVAPNGYYEFYLYDARELFSRGIAPEVITAYDKEEPLANQFEQSWAEFDKYYTPLIKKYPIPYWRFSLDQPPIVSTYPNNVWGNRKPSKEWLARMEAEKQANTPAPPPQNRCWANKNPEPTKTIQLDKASPQYALQRIFWEYSPDLLQQVYEVGNDADAAILEAWDEAKKQDFDEDQSQLWVIARLVGLTNYPIETIIKQLKVKSEGIQPLKQYLADMCNK